MRRLFILTLTLNLTLTLAFVACSKSKNIPTPAFTVTAAINGAPTTFSALITVDSTSTPGTVYIVAHSDSANLTPLFEITLSHTGAIRPGTYPYTDSAGGPLSQLGYTIWSGGTAVQYPSVTDTVILSTVNNTSLSGTFQGTCEYSADSVVSVTNGQFTVGWNQH